MSSPRPSNQHEAFSSNIILSYILPLLDKIRPSCHLAAPHATRPVLPQQSTRWPGHPVPELQVKGEHCRLQRGATFLPLLNFIVTTPLHWNVSSVASILTWLPLLNTTPCSAAHHSSSRAGTHWVCAVWRTAGMVQSVERTVRHRILQVSWSLSQSFLRFNLAVLCCAVLSPKRNDNDSSINPNCENKNKIWWEKRFTFLCNHFLHLRNNELS